MLRKGGLFPISTKEASVTGMASSLFVAALTMAAGSLLAVQANRPHS
jgi:hypothetical protein